MTDKSATQAQKTRRRCALAGAGTCGAGTWRRPEDIHSSNNQFTTYFFPVKENTQARPRRGRDRRWFNMNRPDFHVSLKGRALFSLPPGRKKFAPQASEAAEPLSGTVLRSARSGKLPAKLPASREFRWGR